MCSAVFRTPFSRCPLDGSKLAELADDPLVGTTLDKRYLIEECIGEGGMGRVYRAKHTRMSRHYAIKVLFGDHAGDTRMRSRFAREAEAVSRLNHTNVISVLDFGETKEGLLFLVMDLAHGPSLAHVVHEQAPFPPARAIEILLQLSRGLAHAHEHGLVHRDFKCENVIMVVEEEVEVPKIVDFGICMIIEDSPAQSMLTSNGMIMGTPAVMAPEQASGDKVDHRTDLFSLGIVGYQMLSGCLPFEGTPLDMARKNLYEPIPPIAQRSGVYVAPEIEAIIRGLTAKKPDERYQSAKDVFRALRTVAQQAHLFSGSPGDAPGDWLTTPAPPGSAPPGSFPPGSFPPGSFDSGSAHMGVDASGVHSLGVHARQPTPSDTPMVTEMPFESVKPRRTTALLGIGAVIALAGAVYALKVASTPDSTNQKATPQLAGNAAVANSLEVAADASLLPDTTTEQAAAVLPADAGAAGEADDSAAALTTTEDSPGGDETVSDKSNKRNKANRNSRNHRVQKRVDRNKQTTANDDPADPKVLLLKTAALYAAVGKDLSELEDAKGKAVAADIRADYRNISYSRLMRDSSVQPIYSQSLLRLRKQIRARLNDK